MPLLSPGQRHLFLLRPASFISPAFIPDECIRVRPACLHVRIPSLRDRVILSIEAPAGDRSLTATLGLAAHTDADDEIGGGKNFE